MIANTVNADRSVAASSIRAHEGIAFTPAHPTMATPAAVAFAAATVAAFVGAFQVGAAANG